ncbi:class I SAM-dependent methyltransferase [Zophobihabitans entericus]|uniref:Class I SAM-dependent methyltransferase n=1 Tax=Zophobihabitans entericus TaxID=1635327 RepID=A0A6G9IAL4_9GAMM|nr:class I SAM-dependent methyltransferase [Zophobihabitans entericus]QIQ21266.1 class I SAM-dependent methyltransferase [Zophobihabitans entericus]
MYSKIIQQLYLPEIYTQSDINFWNEEHISKQLLTAHLDPDFEGASRHPEFIKDSVQWIKSILPPKDYPELLDIGCGPGLYTEKFYNEGYQVTGVDFSLRSIDYAKNVARQQALDIKYIYQDYLALEFKDYFDLVTFIYCDYGALSKDNRKIILQKLYQSLKEGGKLLLDVFSTKHYALFQEYKNWENYPDGGFWSKDEYLAISGGYKYPDNVILEQTIVVTGKKMTTFYIWNSCFSAESLMTEVEEAGFKVCDIFSDIKGMRYERQSQTVAILLEK